MSAGIETAGRPAVGADIFVNVEEHAAPAPAVWRLVIDEQPRSGAANMAIDQAIAEACAAGDSLPTLRFYQWQPPAISLGRNQPQAEIDHAAAAAKGYEIVRRPTGGRAILHTDEWTYSVAARQEEARLTGGVMDAYLSISNALLAGLLRLGVPAHKAPASVRAGSDVSAACFEVPSAYEITAGGRKLIGSAQSRRAGYVLQHGSLPLYGDITRLIDVLALEPAAAAALRAELAQRACTLAAALGVGDDHPSVQFGAVCTAMRQGFETTLALTCKPGPMAAGEMRRAAALIREQFANDEWTNAR
jgi:lipoate-protein ligase A